MSEMKLSRRPDWCWIVISLVLLVLLVCAIIVIALLIWCPSFPPKGPWLFDLTPVARSMSQTMLAELNSMAGLAAVL